MQKKINFVLFIFLTCLCSAQSSFELQKLEDFAKIYGVVRYFHPSDEAADINWNSFAAYGVEEISKTKTQKEFEAKIKELFLPVVPSISFNNENVYTWDTKDLFPVFWKHSGLGIDQFISNKKSMYKSSRFNRDTITNSDYNNVNLNISPENISNNLKITYEAKSNRGGIAFVYVRVLNPENKNAIFKTHQGEPVVSNFWEKKELLIENNRPVEKITIGLASSKSGVEFRNVKLWHKDDGNEWRQIELPLFSSNQWKPNKSDTKIEKSDTLLKFTEANDISPYDITWDKQVKIDLSEDFSVTIPIVVYSDKNHTLPMADAKKLEQLQSHLKPENFNRNIALANVIISWNILKHFHPYRDVVKVNWDDVLEKSLKNAYVDKEEYDNSLTLSRLLSNFDDGHMAVNYKGLADKRKYAPGIALRYLDNKLIVKNVFPDIKDIKKGDVIVKINNIETQKYIDSLQQYYSGSRQNKNWLSTLNIARGEKDSKLKLNLSNGKEVTLTRNIESIKNLDFYNRDDVAKSKEINSDTYYVNMDKLSDDEMESEIPTIRKYKNLIIDLRGYPTTDQQHRLLNYLLPIQDSTKWFCHREIYLPDFKYYKEYCSGHGLRKFISDNPLKTNNVLLVDERSISNAEMFSQIVKHYKLATIIGRPTAGANGNINRINLLNSFMIVFTGLNVTNPDGSRFHAIGVIPDILVNETQEDIKKGKDVFVEKALEFFKKKK
jgi:C-terminal processing protease CtpA/Prc